jgi:hypothetical protein
MKYVKVNTSKTKRLLLSTEQVDAVVSVYMALANWPRIQRQVARAFSISVCK